MRKKLNEIEQNFQKDLLRLKKKKQRLKWELFLQTVLPALLIAILIEAARILARKGAKSAVHKLKEHKKASSAETVRKQEKETEPGSEAAAVPSEPAPETDGSPVSQPVETAGCR